MSWSYTFNPASSRLDAVRFLAGDTLKTQPWTLQDEEIEWTLTQTSSPYLAAALACDSIVAKVSGLEQSRSIGDLSVSWSQRHAQFTEKARQLRTRATLAMVATTATGLSLSEKEAADADPDRVAPAHKIEGMRNPSKLDPSET